MVRQINYRTLMIDRKEYVFHKRIRQYLSYNNYIIIRFGSKENDPEYQNIPMKENVHCYDMQGNLKWKYPLGIAGIAKENEKTAILYDGEYFHYVDVATGIEDKDRMTFTK